MPGGRSGLFPASKKQREERRRERIKKRAKPCIMCNPTNGTCLPLGEDCIECVSDKLCEALCDAYQYGHDAATTIVSPEADKAQGGERRGESSAGYIPKITKTGRWSPDQVREVCIRHGYYTRGTNEEYDQMLKLVRLMEPTEEGLYSIALDIARHTVNWDDLSEWDKLRILEDIMDCLDKGAVLHFYRIETEGMT